MTPSKLLIITMTTLLLLSPLTASEIKSASECDTAYDACTEKCEKAENASEDCYQACEKTYETCLSSVQEA